MDEEFEVCRGVLRLRLHDGLGGGGVRAEDEAKVKVKCGWTCANAVWQVGRSATVVIQKRQTSSTTRSAARGKRATGPLADTFIGAGGEVAQMLAQRALRA